MARQLLIRPGAIGDVILSLPALRAASTRADTEIWTPAALVPLLRLGGFTHVRAISATGLDLVGIRGGSELCPSLLEFDSIVSWFGANNDDFREAVRELAFTFLDALPPAESPLHATDFFLLQVGAPPGARPELRLDTRREDYAVIHPFSGSPRKNWPLSSFETLARMLDAPVRWTAGPEEQLAGATRFEDLAELARFLSAACLYIGNDSGVTHLAAAVGTPTIAIFGPSDPRIWAPRGPNVSVVTPPGRAAPAELPPELVLEIATKILERS